jgi:type IV pilus assembly protein PilE
MVTARVMTTTTLTRRANGFTLIEVMITVAIVAILGSIALPSYFDYVRRGQLPEAFSAMADFRIKMEQYYQDHRNYGTSDCADVNPPPWVDATPPALKYGAAKYFSYSCAISGGGQGYTITASGSSGRATGHTFTVDHTNLRKTTQFKGDTVDKSCWMTRGNEC